MSENDRNWALSQIVGKRAWLQEHATRLVEFENFCEPTEPIDSAADEFLRRSVPKGVDPIDLVVDCVPLALHHCDSDQPQPERAGTPQYHWFQLWCNGALRDLCVVEQNSTIGYDESISHYDEDTVNAAPEHVVPSKNYGNNAVHVKALVLLLLRRFVCTKEVKHKIKAISEWAQTLAEGIAKLEKCQDGAHDDRTCTCVEVLDWSQEAARASVLTLFDELSKDPFYNETREHMTSRVFKRYRLHPRSQPNDRMVVLCLHEDEEAAIKVARAAHEEQRRKEREERDRAKEERKLAEARRIIEKAEKKRKGAV